MTSHLSVAAIAVLGLLGVGFVLWLEPAMTRSGVVVLRHDTPMGQPRSGVQQPAQGEGQPAAFATGAPAAAEAGPPGAPAAGGDPAALFVAAIQAASQVPQPLPPPGVANARSLPEAFEAMRAAQGEPRSATAGVSPFGMPAQK